MSETSPASCPPARADIGIEQNAEIPRAGPQTIADQAYRRLEEMIVTLQLPPGTMVTEPILMEKTGFGRTPIREALLRLAEDGLIRIIPRRGILITEVNIREQLLLLELRREVERLIASRAARRATQAQRARFAEMAMAMHKAKETADYLLFLRFDAEFNRFSAACSCNPFAIKMIGSIHALSRRFWSRYAGPDDLAAAAPLHADVMEAIASADEKAAASASDRLMDYVEAFTRSTLDD